MTKETDILNVRLPKQILDWVDELVESGLFNNRSEVIRDFLREYIENQRGKNV